MRKPSEITRAYPIVQAKITEWWENKTPITTKKLQKFFYGENYDADSKSQWETIYGCICRGRDNVIKLWDVYLAGDFNIDLPYVQTYEAEKCEHQIKTLDFDEFYYKLQRGKFGKDTSIILKNLGNYPAVAVLFERKMKEYSKSGNNFLTAKYGPRSVWFIPSFWRWNIREYRLYRRSLFILRRQLDRGIKTRVLLPSGTPIPRVLEYETVVRAALEDGTAWECSKCGARNLAQNNQCQICHNTRA